MWALPRLCPVVSRRLCCGPASPMRMHLSPLAGGMQSSRPSLGLCPCRGQPFPVRPGRRKGRLRSTRVSAEYAVAVGGPKAVLGWPQLFEASGVWPMGRPPPRFKFFVFKIYMSVLLPREG